jgi:KDO2-lipid IV(A) lauroyltransferase
VSTSRDDARPGTGRGRAETVPLHRFFGPRYWPVWFGVSCVRLINLLPWRVQMAIGRALGRLARLFAGRDRHIADVNIRMCLPELDPSQRERLVRDHFESLGCALFETGLVWWASDRRLRPLIEFEGFEHVDRALALGRGAILLSAHFTTLEMGARALGTATPTSIMYATPRNALIAELSRRGRGRHAVHAIPSDEVRELIRDLKRNLVVWYAPDQRYTDKMSAVVPFFGHPAASNVATSRLAKLTGATVLPYFPERRTDRAGYLMRILPPLEDFPSDDPIADTQRFHALIEAHVRRCPAQYLWTYKRFKLPAADRDPYARRAST